MRRRRRGFARDARWSPSRWLDRRRRFETIDDAAIDFCIDRRRVDLFFDDANVDRPTDRPTIQFNSIVDRRRDVATRYSLKRPRRDTNDPSSRTGVDASERGATGSPARAFPARAPTVEKVFVDDFAVDLTSARVALKDGAAAARSSETDES